MDFLKKLGMQKKRKGQENYNNSIGCGIYFHGYM